jgi:gamma-glutamylaminecyclotransferase
MPLVFVYGTLKRGGSNHAHLAGQRYLGDARTAPGFTLYSLGDYPGLVHAATDTAGVSGELWQVDAPCLAALDHLEGVAEGLYARVPIQLATPPGEQIVETYLYLGSITGRQPLGSIWPV